MNKDKLIEAVRCSNYPTFILVMEKDLMEYNAEGAMPLYEGDTLYVDGHFTDIEIL